MPVIFFLLSISTMSHDHFKKHPYRPVDFKGQGPLYVCILGMLGVGVIYICIVLLQPLNAFPMFMYMPCGNANILHYVIVMI